MVIYFDAIEKALRDYNYITVCNRDIVCGSSEYMLTE